MTRPDVAAALAPLKGFQRSTVDYAFERLYLANDSSRRFLVADEVGLGKTLVARGVIAKAIDHLWDRVQRIDIAGLPIVTYAARAPQMSVEELSWFVDDVVTRDLQGVKGVAKIERVGGVEREIRVTLDPDRLAAFGVTAADVNRQLRATHVDLAGGRGEVGASEQSIRTLAGTDTLAGLADTAVALPGGPWEFIRGGQDPEANPGGPARELTLAPRDGRILLRADGGSTTTTG